jgi:hypothetical protein
VFRAAVAVPRPAPDPEPPPPPAEAPAEEPVPPPEAVEPRSEPTLTGKRWKAAGDQLADRRKEVATAALTTTGDDDLSPLSTTTGQFALVLVVVGLVGGAMAAWTLRTPRQ